MVILFLDPKLMFCDESAAQLFSANWTVSLRKNFFPKCFRKRLKSGFSTPQNTKCKIQNAKCKIPFQFFQMLVINKITCTSFRTCLPPKASRKQLTSCSSTSQIAKSHIPYLLNCVLASAKCLFWIR